ncbi:MAG: YbfB/YjiJ family MFS transporter [Arcobacteraceae bacterium]
MILNKNNNFAILLAGILSLTIGVGVARFAFTSLLPSMLEDFLTIQYAGLYASINFAGYLSGALFAMFIKDINTKVKYFRIGILLCIFTTLILATTVNEMLWLISRILAGFGSAMVLIVGGSIVMVKLNYENKTKAMGIYFTGIGSALVLCELISQYVLTKTTWNDVWMILVLYSIVISIYVVYILSFDKEIKKDPPKHTFSFKIFTPYVIFLTLAYFTAGVGFVVQGTFLPDIIHSLEGLEEYGSLVWLCVGIAGIPSAVIWMRLAHKYGSVNIIIVVMFLHIAGILIPTISNGIFLNLLSGALYGSTFIALVALFMTLGGKIAPQNPVVLMGAFTTAYGIGQVFAPLYSIKLISIFGNYDSTLYLTAFIVFIGIVFLFLAKKVESNKL